MIIYKATNKINGKVYIGQTIKTINIRRSQHEGAARKGRKSRFHASLRKHGSENFEWTILKETEEISKLNELEEYYIEYYKSDNKNHGYNLNAGGSNALKSEETKEKLRISNTGKKRSPQTILAIKASKKDVYKFDGHPQWREDLDDNKIVELRRQGFSLGKIAKLMKCSRRAIENHLIKNLGKESITKKYLKSIKKIERPLIHRASPEQVEELLNEGLNYTQIMKILKMSNNALQKRLKIIKAKELIEMLQENKDV